MHLERKKQSKIVHDDGSVQVKITGCEYKITEERLSEILTHWGVLNSRITEEVFNDPHDKEGSNRTGIYLVRMMIHQDIPEWLPAEGLRIKIQYAKIKKQFNNCYENHLRKDCENEKLSWSEYVKKFRLRYPEIPDEFYGKWINKKKLQRPTEADFHLPKNQEEWNILKSNMLSCGFDESKISSMMQERLENFKKALTEFKLTEELN